MAWQFSIESKTADSYEMTCTLFIMQERLDSVEAAQEFHGLKMEYIESEMRGFKKKMESLEIKDRDILGDLSKLDKIVAGLGISLSSLTSPRVIS